MMQDMTTQSPGPMRVFLHSRSGLGARKIHEQFALGLTTDPAPYGFDASEDLGIKIEYSEDKPETGLQRKLFARLQFDLIHAWHNRAAIRRADVVWTVLEWEWVPIALMQRLGVIDKKPIIGNSVWLCHNWPNWGWRRRAIWRLAMTKFVFKTLHAQRSLELSKKFFRVPFHLLHFGISTRAFAITPPVIRKASSPIRLYAIGDDATRDWQTLLDAFGNDENFEIAIVCRWLSDDHLKKYSNLRIPRNVTVQTQRSCYEEADLVLIPMRENCFSGITVACEAAAMGKPVVCSDTGGVDGYFSQSEVKFVPPGDVNALRQVVSQTTPEEFYEQAKLAQSRFISSGYSAIEMVARYKKLSEVLLQQLG